MLPVELAGRGLPGAKVLHRNTPNSKSDPTTAAIVNQLFPSLWAFELDLEERVMLFPKAGLRFED